MASAEHPRPRVTPESRRYWEAAAAGRLLLGWCDSCDRHHHPPQASCPFCWAPAGHRDARGDGIVDAVSVVHSTRVPEFAGRVPYAVVRVRLSEGVHLVSNVVGVAPAAVRVGMAVAVHFERVADGIGIPLFRPAPG